MDSYAKQTASRGTTIEIRRQNCWRVQKKQQVEQRCSDQVAAYENNIKDLNISCKFTKTGQGSELQ